MGGDYRGARPAALGDVPVHALNDQVFAIFGDSVQTIGRAGGVVSDSRVMACKVEVGAFRFKVGVGDTADTLAPPIATDIVAGGQSVQFTPTDGIFYLSRNSEMMIQGEGASDILTYWFV